MLSEGRAPEAYLARKTLKPVSGSCSPISMRGLTILDVDCANAPDDPIEEIRKRPIVTVRVVHNLRMTIE